MGGKDELAATWQRRVCLVKATAGHQRNVVPEERPSRGRKTAQMQGGKLSYGRSSAWGTAINQQQLL